MLRYWIAESKLPFHQPRYNVAPGQMIPAIIHDGAKNRLGELRWGLVPSWAEDQKSGYKLINARSETVHSKFYNLVSRKRCLIPADGFYEWKTSGTSKQPMRITLQSRELFSMAAIYDTWISPDKQRLSTCSILTTAPNSLMAPIHQRMPVILKPEDEGLWLDPRVNDVTKLRRLFHPYPPEEMNAYAVSTRVGNTKFDDAACLEPWSDQPDLFGE